MNRPLAGIRILEVGQMLAGPYCGMLLADLGAEVIKIESPEGDIARRISPHWIGPHNTYFASLNRNKLSVTLDLASPQGRRKLGELARSAHALIANLRPPAIKKLGLTYDVLRTWNPALVCVSITGYGLDSPYADRPAYDYVIQALTGIMAITGDPDGTPTKTGYSAVDNSAGIFGALGLLAKIVAGEGGQVDVAMYDVMLSQLNYLACAWLNAGEHAERLARSAHPYIVPAQIFETRDGWLVLFVTHDGFWRRFCTEVGQPEWLTDERFATMAARRQNREIVVSAIATLTATACTHEWVERLAPLGIVVAPVETMEQALASEQVKAREMVVSIPAAGAVIRAVGNPLKIDGDEPRYAAPPLLGEHNALVLGMDDDRSKAATTMTWATEQAGQPAGASQSPPKTTSPVTNRRALGRALSRIANATVDQVLAGLVLPPAGRAARRIGVTGAAGVGKSTLISRLARRRLDHGCSIGIIAVDPTSPFSHGAVLGDRIRMEQIADDPRLFIRSLASREAHDGLADNISDVLLAMDAHGFDEVVLETLGVGQADYAVRTLVDTVVLVLGPDSGDRIQMMKSGLIETADVYVVNKADLPRARKIAAELSANVKVQRRLDASWHPPVILTTDQDPASVGALDEAVTAHLAWTAAHQDLASHWARREYHVKSLIMRRLSEVLANADNEGDRYSVAELYDLVLSRVAEPAGARRPQATTS